jgi:hypothetical protein
MSRTIDFEIAAKAMKKFKKDPELALAVIGLILEMSEKDVMVNPEFSNFCERAKNIIKWIKED